jgi:hypothetical protein
MANSAYWFKHDTNAKDDHKIMLLMDQLGLEGYGIFWVLIETLREQSDYRYPLAMLPILAKRYMTSAEKMKAVVLSYGLFDVFEDERFASPSLLRRMDAYDEVIEKRRISGAKGGAKRAENVANAKQVPSKRVANAKQTCSKVVASRDELSRDELSKLPKVFSESPYKDESYEFADWFKKITVDTVKYDKDKWAMVWDALRRIDKRDNVSEMTRAIEWARNDHFWSSNFLSPLKLRTLDKNGEMHIDRFIRESKKNGGTNGKRVCKTGSTDDEWRDAYNRLTGGVCE